jgi:hypothetical protein
MRMDQAEKPVRAEQEVALANEAEQRSRRNGKNVAAPQASGEIGAVHGAHARPHHHVGFQAMRHERPQHADLDGAEAAASGKHERRLRLARFGRGGRM